MPAHSKNPNPYIVHCKSRQDVLCCEKDESCCRHVTNVPSVSLFAQWCAAHPVTSVQNNSWLAEEILDCPLRLLGGAEMWILVAG